MYQAPILKTKPAKASSTPDRHQLLLVHSKKPLAAALVNALVPARLAQSHGALKGERGAKLVLHHGQATTVIMGIGELKQFTPQEAAEWGENAAHALVREHVDAVDVSFPDDLSDKVAVLNFLKGMAMGNYRLEELKSSDPAKPNPPRTELKEIRFSGRGASKLTPQDLNKLRGVLSGIAFARDLVELPANHANPEGVVARFKKAVSKLSQNRLEVEVWDEKRIHKEGMGLIGAVSRGSHCPPRFLIVRYGKKTGRAPTLALVGKGVTFDTGGVNLKVQAWRELIWMKKDMAGAAAVLGAMLAIAETKPAINVIGITPLTTNELGSGSTIPGDVVRSYAGKTVEIQNTDAEGRLILADALHYAVQQKPSWIVDVATLTGACVVALGNHHSGAFSNNDRFQGRVLEATRTAGEPAWPMPMSPRYGDELKSQLADLGNMGKGRDGGATLGAKFLERFVGDLPWCHLDIAGTADLGEPAYAGAQVHAAGRMVHSFAALADALGKR